MDKTAKIWMVVAILLFIVIIAMTTMLFTLPGKETVPGATTTPQKVVTKAPVKPAPTGDKPLSSRVSVTTPQANTTVGATFVVKGKAPGNWFFEASFPIQVRDKDGNVIGRTHGSAQGDWMATELVAFSATVNIEGGYKGPATLILMRDNPSGLPENDDAVEIAITVN